MSRTASLPMSRLGASRDRRHPAIRTPTECTYSRRSPRGTSLGCFGIQLDITNRMRIRIVSADQTAATFYDVEHLADGLRVARRLEHPAGHLHNRDLVSDRPGRKDDHAPLSGRRRGATAHHGTGGERSPHKHEAQVFVRQIVEELERERAGFDRLVLMAGPEMLGLLRDALSEGLRGQLIAEVGKDLEGQPSLAVLEHLPRTVFARPTHP